MREGKKFPSRFKGKEFYSMKNAMTKKSTNSAQFKKIMRAAREDPTMGVTGLVEMMRELAGSLRKKKDPELAREFLRLKKLLAELRTEAVCPRCGGSLYLSDLEGYEYVCPSCDENFFDFEVASAE